MNTFNGWQSLGFKSYKDYLKSHLWKEKRDFYLSLYPTCEKCLCSPSEEVHHITYERAGNEKKEDLLAICRRCHRRIHNK